MKLNGVDPSLVDASGERHINAGPVLFVMRISFRKRTPGQIEFGVIYGGIALLALCAGRFLPVMDLFPACVFKGLTGIPCPACGSTRSVMQLSYGNIAQSLTMNPLTSVVFMVAAPFFIYSLVTLLFDAPRFSLSFTDREKDRIRGVAGALIIGNWIYLILTL